MNRGFERLPVVPGCPTIVQLFALSGVRTEPGDSARKWLSLRPEGGGKGQRGPGANLHSLQSSAMWLALLLLFLATWWLRSPATASDEDDSTDTAAEEHPVPNSTTQNQTRTPLSIYQATLSSEYSP